MQREEKKRDVMETEVSLQRIQLIYKVLRVFFLMFLTGVADIHTVYYQKYILLPFV